jgi:hypothetical protein
MRKQDKIKVNRVGCSGVDFGLEDRAGALFSPLSKSFQVFSKSSNTLGIQA